MWTASRRHTYNVLKGKGLCRFGYLKMHIIKLGTKLQEMVPVCRWLVQFLFFDDITLRSFCRCSYSYLERKSTNIASIWEYTYRRNVELREMILKICCVREQMSSRKSIPRKLNAHLISRKMAKASSVILNRISFKMAIDLNGQGPLSHISVWESTPYNEWILYLNGC